MWSIIMSVLQSLIGLQTLMIMDRITGARLFVFEYLLTPHTSSFIENHKQVEFYTRLPIL